MTDPKPLSEEQIETLRPCPFCGRTNVHAYCVADEEDDSCFWWVKCREACDAEGPVIVGRANAIAAWNSRASESSLLATIESLKKERDEAIDGSYMATVIKAQKEAIRQLGKAVRALEKQVESLTKQRDEALDLWRDRDSEIGLKLRMKPVDGLAYYDERTCEIVVNPELPEVGKHIAFLHEALHAADASIIAAGITTERVNHDWIENVSVNLLTVLVAFGFWRGVTFEELMAFDTEAYDESLTKELENRK